MTYTETSSDLERRIRGLRRRLVVERVVFGTALLAVGSALVYPRFFTPGYTLAVGNHPLVAVADRETAERVLEKVKGGGLQVFRSSGAPGTNDQRRPTTDHRPPAETSEHLNTRTPEHLNVSLVPPVRLVRGRRPEVTVEDEENAARTVARAVVVVAPRAAVVVNGNPVVGLPSESDARATLQMVKAHYAGMLPELEEEPRFKETVEIKTLSLPSALWRPTAAVAAAALRGASGADGDEYRVKPGDTSSEIAHAHHLGLAELQRLNRGVSLHPLRSGCVLRVRPARRPPVTVIAKRTVRAPQLVPFATRKIPSQQMVQGKHLLFQPGRPGKVMLTTALVYENGVFTGKQTLGREVLVPSREKVVAVGTRTKG